MKLLDFISDSVMITNIEEHVMAKRNLYRVRVRTFRASRNFFFTDQGVATQFVAAVRLRDGVASTFHNLGEPDPLKLHTSLDKVLKELDEICD
jgi:hypothetical protein